jgi:hypothetical protein
MRYHFFLFVSVLVTSCLHQEYISIIEDFEEPHPYWNGINVVSGEGHSGKKFTRADSASAFSSVYFRPLGTISQKPINRIDIAVWLRANDPSTNAQLVLSIDKSDSTLLYLATKTDETKASPGEWTRISASYDIEEQFPPGSTIKIYVWNTGKGSIDADDFTIKFFPGRQEDFSSGKTQP